MTEENFNSKLYPLMFILLFTAIFFTNNLNIITRYMGIVAIIMIFLITIIIRIKNDRNDISKTFLVFIILTISVNLIGFLNTLDEVNFYSALSNLIYMIIPVLCLSIGYFMSNKLSIEIVVNTSLVYGILQIVIVILQNQFINFKSFTYLYFTNYEKYFDIERIVGTVGNPNHLSIFIVSIFIVITSYHLNRNNLKIVFFLPIIFLFFIPIYLSQSKTGLIAYSILLISLILSKKTSWYKRILWLLIGAIIIIIINNQFLVYSGREIDLESMSGRSLIWEKYLSLYFFESDLFKIIFGHGLHIRELVVDNFYLQNYMIYGLLGLFIQGFILILFMLNAIIIKEKWKKTMLITMLLFLIITDYTAVTTLVFKISFLIYFIIGYCLYPDYKSKNIR